MSQQWYAKIQNELRGPLSTLEIKQLAFAGEILPDSLIRLNSDGKWVKASQVKGLSFPSEDDPSRLTEQWVVKQGENLTEPIRTSHLQRLLDTGQVTGDTYVRRNSDGHWMSVKDVQGISFMRGDTRPRSGEDEQPNPTSTQIELDNPYQSPAFSEDERPKPATPLRLHELGKTKKGLMAVYYGICAVLLAVVIGIFMGPLGSVGGDVLSVVLGLVGIIAGGVGYISILTGQIMCISVPRESNARKPCQIALGLQFASIALYVFSNFILPILITVGMSGFNILVAGIGLLAVVNPLITLAGYLYFLTFLKNLSLYINRKDLSSVSAKITVRVIVSSVMLFCFLVSPFLFIVLPTLGMGLVALYGVLAIVVAITFIVTFVKYANHVRAVAEAVNV